MERVNDLFKDARYYRFMGALLQGVKTCEEIISFGRCDSDSPEGYVKIIFPDKEEAEDFRKLLLEMDRRWGELFVRDEVGLLD